MGPRMSKPDPMTRNGRSRTKEGRYDVHMKLRSSRPLVRVLDVAPGVRRLIPSSKTGGGRGLGSVSWRDGTTSLGNDSSPYRFTFVVNYDLSGPKLRVQT